VGQPSDPCRGLEAVVFFMSFLGIFVMLPKISFNVTKKYLSYIVDLILVNGGKWAQNNPFPLIGQSLRIRAVSRSPATAPEGEVIKQFKLLSEIFYQ
jgi:hypothetical protein